MLDEFRTRAFESTFIWFVLIWPRYTEYVISWLTKSSSLSSSSICTSLYSSSIGIWKLFLWDVNLSLKCYYFESLIEFVSPFSTFWISIARLESISVTSLSIIASFSKEATSLLWSCSITFFSLAFSFAVDSLTAFWLSDSASLRINVGPLGSRYELSPSGFCIWGILPENWVLKKSSIFRFSC